MRAWSALGRAADNPVPRDPTKTGGCAHGHADCSTCAQLRRDLHAQAQRGSGR